MLSATELRARERQESCEISRSLNLHCSNSRPPSLALPRITCLSPAAIQMLSKMQRNTTTHTLICLMRAQRWDHRSDMQEPNATSCVMNRTSCDIVRLLHGMQANAIDPHLPALVHFDRRALLLFLTLLAHSRLRNWLILLACSLSTTWPYVSPGVTYNLRPWSNATFLCWSSSFKNLISRHVSSGLLPCCTALCHATWMSMPLAK